jgi:hypothetical protein
VINRSNPLTGLAAPTILAALVSGSLDILIGVIAAVLTAHLLNRFGNTVGRVMGAQRKVNSLPRLAPLRSGKATRQLLPVAPTAST